MLYSSASNKEAEIAIDKMVADLKENWVKHCPQSHNNETCLQYAIDKYTETSFIIKTSIVEEIEQIIKMPIPLYNDTHTKKECIDLLLKVKELVL